MLIKATKNGKTAVFAENVWNTGQPQRYGWHSDIEMPKKTLPIELLEFAEIRKKPKPEPEQVTKLKIAEPDPEPEKVTKSVTKPKRKPKTKK